jgi:ribosome-associated protein
MPAGSPGTEELDRAGEIRFEFFRSSGPGGQNVNKVATAVRLRLDVRRSRVLSEEVKARLATLAGARMTSRGTLVIEAQRHRTQEQNRQDALTRLEEILLRASRSPARRRATKPSLKSRERRLETKRRRGRLKSDRLRKIEPEG